VFYTQQEACHGIKCHQKCEIKQDCEDINWRAKKQCEATKEDKDFNLFAFPQEPVHSINAVGNPLILSSFVQDKSKFETAKNLSRVSNYLLNQSGSAAANDIESYSGFFEVEKSNLFFWFFPAEKDAKNKPLIVWLQGGPGSTSMYGLLKENGPYLVEAKYLPFGDPHLVKNHYSWHKVANILYIDNPVGTGFSHFKNNKTGYFPGEETGDQVERELAELLLQFLKLFPTYVGSTNAQLKPKTYLFGESYGGAYVVSLGTYILANDKYKQVINLGGIGIGNGWVSPKFQCRHALVLKSMGLVNAPTYKKLVSFETETNRLIENGDLWKALSNWQQEMKFMHSSLKLINLYDFTRARSDVSEQNFWHFLQKSEVREAIHVGDTFFDGGSRVLNRFYHKWMKDQSDSLASLLNNGIPVLVYHGNFDLVLPVNGMSEALYNLQWNGLQKWSKAENKPYFYSDINGDKELMGYIQSADGLSFVVVRNAGHMVPIDSPSWSLKIVEDFLKKTE